MQTEELKNPSHETSENDWSKEIEIAESIKKQALDHYKREAIDTWNIQHSVIRNYLWLSLTFIAGYSALFNTLFNLSQISHYCLLVMLAIAFISALIALAVGIYSMTGTSGIEPDDNYEEMFEYQTRTGYCQGNHYALLQKEIHNIKQAIEEAQNKTHERGKAMRRMNKCLFTSIGFGVLSIICYLL